METYLKIFYYSLKNEPFLNFFLSNKNDIADILVYLKENVQGQMHLEHFRRKTIDLLKIQIEILVPNSERKSVLLKLLTRVEAQPDIELQVS